ncbi:putative methyltransferase tdiE [Fusarium oxysporum f. sp. albedinis]|nr:hypothetical protein HZ326_21582 [Fusarium oxysporum f. sp. albedinis]KAJ0157833.1 putative methyltransferase tdiE [Fusarium oxysporum f. sp. albedinis]
MVVVSMLRHCAADENEPSLRDGSACDGWMDMCPWGAELEVRETLTAMGTAIASMMDLRSRRWWFALVF